MGFSRLIIRTDSHLVYRGMTEWLPEWLRTNWRKNRVKTQPDFERLLEATHELHVKFEHVRGHSEEMGNRIADGLARSAATRCDKESRRDCDEIA